MAPRCPPSDHIPRQICQPHELLRAQLTHPEPPDFDDDLPSFPARSACTGVLIVSINLTSGHGGSGAVRGRRPGRHLLPAVHHGGIRLCRAGPGLRRACRDDPDFRGRAAGLRVPGNAAVGGDLLRGAGIGLSLQRQRGDRTEREAGSRRVRDQARRVPRVTLLGAHLRCDRHPPLGHRGRCRGGR